MKAKVTYVGSSQFNIFNPNGEVSYDVSRDVLDDNFLCEGAFHIFNAPTEYLNEGEQKIALEARKLRLTSLSVGDTVRIEDEDGKREYLCENTGWTKK